MAILSMREKFAWTGGDIEPRSSPYVVLSARIAGRIIGIPFRVIPEAELVDHETHVTSSLGARR